MQQPVLDLVFQTAAALGLATLLVILFALGCQIPGWLQRRKFRKAMEHRDRLRRVS